MDKTAIKKFATSARIKLIEGVKLRALKFGISEDGIVPTSNFEKVVLINGEPVSNSHMKSYKILVENIANYQKNYSFQESYELVMEEVAYTWFNRIIAIRYMELHDYLPIRMRILSSENRNKIEPDAVTEVKEIIEELSLNPELVWELQEKQVMDELFKYILIQQSHQLGQILPSAFPKLNSFEELLLPDNLLSEYGVVRDLIDCEIPTEDWNEVEIIGWLYQFYNADVKEQVGGLKNNSVSKRYLPTVTQLFTPKWIVRYMLQNSLGKLYDEKYPNNQISKNWEFYLKSKEKISIVPAEINTIEDIKLIDPACGSGHILLEAFDLFYDMYEEQGYSDREIPSLIIEKNLYGLEIDQRSNQISHVAILLKMLERQPRLLRKKQFYDFHIEEFRDTQRVISNEALELVYVEDEIAIIRDLEVLLKNAKQFGTLLKIDLVDYEKLLKKAMSEVEEKSQELFSQALQYELQDYLIPLLRVAVNLTQEYAVVVTNPPYHNKFNPELKKFMQKNYPLTKSDMYSAFIEKCFSMTTKNGYAALMTPYTWMFISSHEKLRRMIIEDGTITSLVQLEYSAFEDATVPLCTFVIQNQLENRLGEYVRLEGFKGADIQPIKVREAASSEVKYHYRRVTNSFFGIPGSPIAYWASKKILTIFDKNDSLENIAQMKQGMATSDNERFLRMWYEVIKDKIGLGLSSNKDAEKSHRKWFPYNKGGTFRKWYGNNEYVVNWEKNGLEIREFTQALSKLRPGGRIKNKEFYFLEGVTWSALSSGKISFRYCENGFLFDTKGSMLFLYEKNDVPYILALINSVVIDAQLRILAPTLDFNPASIRKISFISKSDKKIENLVNSSVTLSKSDWDSFETSWDFEKHPFLTYQNNYSKLSKIYQDWETVTTERFNQLKSNEEELNRIFIDLYELQDELTPDVPDKEVTVRKADKARDVRSFLSYLVGVIFGRYSLDQPGLAFAGGTFDSNHYHSFKPDSDNIIPITHEHYFEDDIIVQIEELISLIYGIDQLESNLIFIAEALEMKANEDSRGRIRRYFMKEFYKDHLKIYQKRPIYWQFTSGKLGAFKGLMYLHRYDSYTLARLRTDYVLALTKTIEDLIGHADIVIDGDATPKVIATARKEKEGYQKQLEELRNYDLVLKYLADQEIELELDDGVKVNYAKFQGIEIGTDVGKKITKMNIFEKI
ncbi:BREX-1 system adenine-specific DNA-methyltransferase PglX [Carnobacterium sp.]|uniref:BREX-1 system adenine-specific DNA-methyltransferase PglX n=1 Tax=Carnobacterium sp. TaxID=48221 RepID=UPI002FCB7F13